MYYFLPEDFEKLNEKIAEICDKIKEIGKEMGESCREGAETFHDNFAYEDGERQQAQQANRVRQLIGIRNNSRVVTTQSQKDSNSVSIGKTVDLQDETGQKHTYVIGSYLTFTEEEHVISYNSPLARLIIGARVGDVKTGQIGHSKKTFTIMKIS
jgi:transcription elongation GreA/GreB family factor